MNDSPKNPTPSPDRPSLVGQTPPHLQPESIDALRQLLRRHGVDTTSWSQGRYKSVENLWEEVITGESRFATDPFRRVLRGVVQVIIRRGEHILIEAEQIFHDGRRRPRSIPPSEKMLPGESYADAAIRCLHEELHIAPTRIRVLEHSHKVHTDITTSYSYPGLLSQYTIHKVEVEVRDMPDHDFWTVELGDHNDHVVKNHFWAWRLPVEAAD